MELNELERVVPLQKKAYGLLLWINKQALASPDIAQDLSLWAYGCELVRRAQFASQVSAVHRLWLDLDEKTRKELSAELIWQARERLVRWLTKKQTRAESNA